MKAVAIAIVGTASIVASADAGFLGFVAFIRPCGGNTVIDVFVGVEHPNDRFLNVYNANISTTLPGGFVQKAGLGTKTWRPDTAGFTSTRNTCDDSFLTAGTFSGGAYGGNYYASSNTAGDGNFVNNSWNATQTSPAANTIPTNAGWYTGDVTSIDNRAESLRLPGMGVRWNTLAAPANGNTRGSLGSASANYGIWCAHLVVAGTNAVIMGNNVLWSAASASKDGVTTFTSIGTSGGGGWVAVPAPGALAVLGIAGFASRRRRA